MLRNDLLFVWDSSVTGARTFYFRPGLPRAGSGAGETPEAAPGPHRLSALTWCGFTSFR